MAVVNDISIVGIPAVFKEANHDFSKVWRQFDPKTEVLPAGWRKAEGRRPLKEHLVFDQEVAITLRDGVTIYADVFRPPSSDNTPVPGILAWSPYGKQGNGLQGLDRVPWRAGVPRDATSDLEKFEALDPAEWCPRGYAIVNVDSRGVGESEGNMYMLGTQEGRDGYDVIEYLATLPWCNGSLALAGNSYLAAVQWFIAAEKPPHLKAIAPWEGLADYYRELTVRGGIPNTAFVEYRGSGYVGRNMMEDTAAMSNKYPFWNAYWDDKSPKFANIECPIYALSSFSTMLHTEGTIRGFLFSSSQDKWLRIHDNQEWYDLYQQSSIDDLQKFFDRYLHGKNNGWEATPQIRHSLLGYNIPNIVNREETTYPPPYVSHHTFYLDAANSSMSPLPPPSNTPPATTSYQSDSWSDDGAHFTYTFPTYTELIGFSQAHLYMSSPSTHDMDVYIILRKLSRTNEPLTSLNIPLSALPTGTTASHIPNLNIFKYLGPNGRLRASHRALGADPTLTPAQRAMLAPATAWHPHNSEQLIPPGEVVRLDIPVWPGGMIFDAGEKIRFEVKGHEVTLPEFPALAGGVQTNRNVGRHFVHTGGEYVSRVVLSLAEGGDGGWGSEEGGKGVGGGRDWGRVIEG